MAADIRQLEQVLSIVEGIDTVWHLAGDPNLPAPWESVYENNILGVRNILEAARLANVRRVGFASTNHVMGKYDQNSEWPVYNDMPQRPDSFYGASKAIGQEIACWKNPQPCRPGSHHEPVVMSANRRRIPLP